MKKPTFNNYGTPALLMFGCFILLSFYTSGLQKKNLTLLQELIHAQKSHRVFVAKHDSMIDSNVDSINSHFTVLKAHGE